jgi:hypothetical protein
LELTPDRHAAAEACGCVFLPATDEQIGRLSMQRRVFRIAGRPFVATRDGGGFFETHATLARLIEVHGRGGGAGKQETVADAAAADAASEREIAEERGAGGAQEVRRRRAATRRG